MKNSTNLDLPSLLAFERKLENSDGLMFSGIWGIDPDTTKPWERITIIPRYNRSTQSAYGTLDDKKSQPNPVASANDDANLPLEHDTLKLSFTLRVVGNLGKPFACNSPDFEKSIVQKVEIFKTSDGIKELAKRYAYNIANGRFLWRNRVGVEKIKIIVNLSNQSEVLIFDATTFSLSNFDIQANSASLKTLATAIENALIGVGTHTLITVNAFVKLGSGQHVFPSQEMNMGEKGKVLFKINGQAAMHNVKIGNALRTVDTWYRDYSETNSPIAAEPYGAVTQRGQAYRKSKDDFYTLLVLWLNDKEIGPDQQAYVVSNLIRGGVFSKESEKKGKTNSEGVGE